MPSMKHFDDYVNRKAGLKFMGHDMTFLLSHGLFSSYDIDEGSKLLLKTIAQGIDLTKAASALDVGCGVGVIGICVNRSAPHIATVLQDRDALAVAFAERNCLMNANVNIAARCGLALQDLEERSFDLVLSNLPAKAGQPVLEALLREIPLLMTASGRMAVVVINPIEPFVRNTLRSLGYEITYTESTKSYTVFHARAGLGAEGSAHPPDRLSAYIRTKKSFSRRDFSYRLETVYNLPDFDTLGYPIELSFDSLSSVKVGGDVLFWNPGQGHLPVYLALRNENRISRISLAGRDSLELAITKRNLLEAGTRATESIPVPSESFLIDVLPEGSIDFFCASPHPIPRVSWQKELEEAALYLVRKGGTLFVVGKSTEIHRFLAGASGFILKQSRKYNGYRAVLMQKAS